MSVAVHELPFGEALSSHEFMFDAGYWGEIHAAERLIHSAKEPNRRDIKIGALMYGGLVAKAMAQEIPYVSLPTGSVLEPDNLKPGSLVGFDIEAFEVRREQFGSNKQMIDGRNYPTQARFAVNCSLEQMIGFACRDFENPLLQAGKIGLVKRVRADQVWQYVRRGWFGLVMPVGKHRNIFSYKWVDCEDNSVDWHKLNTGQIFRHRPAAVNISTESFKQDIMPLHLVERVTEIRLYENPEDTWDITAQEYERRKKSHFLSWLLN